LVLATLKQVGREKWMVEDYEKKTGARSAFGGV
jgi:hypothetical protein